MPRVAVDWRSASKDNYKDFCKKHPLINLSFEEWQSIIYEFNDGFKYAILETGNKEKLPCGFGEFSINKKKRKKVNHVDGKEFVNLPIDWKRTKERGKITYNFNYHTEGYHFGWRWFKETARFRHSDVWYFRPSRATSRMLSHYIKTDKKYQYMYNEWIK